MNETGSETYNSEVCSVKSGAMHQAPQSVNYFFGISAATVGAKKLSMSRVEIPPGACSTPHIHNGFETGIYVLQGSVETRYGSNLEKTQISEAGEFLFIPPNLPHQAKNLSDTEKAVAIVVRDDPNEHENVLPYTPRSK